MAGEFGERRATSSKQSITNFIFVLDSTEDAVQVVLVPTSAVDLSTTTSSLVQCENLVPRVPVFGGRNSSREAEV
eukprot:scaffold3535_cov162-Ochromonas_danica.AAC.1